MTFIPPPEGPSIIEFAMSKRYLGKDFLSVHQVAILKGLYGLVMSREERLAFLELTEGREPRKIGYQEAVLILGVRSGKSLLASIIATFESVRWGPMLHSFLTAGQTATGILIAQDRKGAGIVRDYIVGNLQTLEDRGFEVFASTQGQEKAVTEHIVRLRWPIEICVYSANAYAVRGVTGLWFIGDEACWWKSEEGAYNQDEKVMKAVRSRFATLSRLRPKQLLISSKNEEQGVVYETWKKRESNKVLVAMGATWEINPSVEQEFLDREEEKDPEAFAVEYGKAWYKPGGGNSFLPAAVIDECVDVGRTQTPARAGTEYLAWMDAAFKRDRFSFGIAHVETRNGEPSVPVDLMRHWTPPRKRGQDLDPEQVIGEIVEELRHYGCDKIHGDQFADVMIKQQFAKAHITFIESPVSVPEKFDAFKNLRAALRAGRVRLPDDEITLRDLKGLISIQKRTAGGSFHNVVTAPNRRGAYDDAANVVARLVARLMPITGRVDLAEANAAAAPDRGFPGLDWRQPPKEGEFHGGIMEAVY